MDSRFAEIIWSKESEEDLDTILEHYLKYAPETAHKRIIRILMELKNCSSPNNGKLMNTIRLAEE